MLSAGSVVPDHALYKPAFPDAPFAAAFPFTDSTTFYVLFRACMRVYVGCPLTDGNALRVSGRLNRIDEKGSPL